MRTKNLEYYAFILLVFVLIGFWPSYFSKFFDKTADLSQYFHLHAATALLWILLLIVQPILIRTNRINIHRLLGKFSYILFPLLFLSIILLAHSRNDPERIDAGAKLWISFKDMVIIGFGYFVAIIYRNYTAIHVRGMVITGLVLIEPTMFRVFVKVLGIELPLGHYLAVGIIYFILVFLIFSERKQKRGRWVFPSAFGLILVNHIIYFKEISIPLWDAFAKWFLSLPLT